MNALRVAARHPARALRHQRLASTISVVSHTSSVSALPLSNVEAQWEKLAKEEQVAIYRQLEILQKKDWKTLTIDEKKAGAYRTAFVTTNMSFPFRPVYRDQRALTILPNLLSSVHDLYA
jgi:cytochrome c oxidase subunit 4